MTTSRSKKNKDIIACILGSFLNSVIEQGDRQLCRKKRKQRVRISTDEKQVSWVLRKEEVRNSITFPLRWKCFCIHGQIEILINGEKNLDPLKFDLTFSEKPSLPLLKHLFLVLLMGHFIFYNIHHNLQLHFYLFIVDLTHQTVGSMTAAIMPALFTTL